MTKVQVADSPLTVANSARPLGPGNHRRRLGGSRSASSRSVAPTTRFASHLPVGIGCRQPTGVPFSNPCGRSVTIPHHDDRGAPIGRSDRRPRHSAVRPTTDARVAFGSPAPDEMIVSRDRTHFAWSPCQPGGSNEPGTLILGAHASGQRRRLTTRDQIHGLCQPDEYAPSRPQQRWQSRLDGWDGRGRMGGIRRRSDLLARGSGFPERMDRVGLSARG